MGSKPDLETRTMHPNSLAAIEPYQWQTGQSGNVNGRKTLGAALKTCLNAMEAMTITEVQAIARDKQRSVTWRAAAKRVLGMMRDGFHNHIPLAGSDFDRCSDRTDGKPIQAVHVTTTTIRPPAVIGVDKAPLVLQCFASIPPAERPALLKQMIELDQPVLEAEPID